jgi:hypothetical protein
MGLKNNSMQQFFFGEEKLLSFLSFSQIQLIPLSDDCLSTYFDKVEEKIKPP